MMLPEKCSHGKSYKEPCCKCDLLLLEMSLARYEEHIKETKEKIAICKEKLAQELTTQEQPNDPATTDE